MYLKDLVDIKIGLPLDRKKHSYLTDAAYAYDLLTLKSFATTLSIPQDTIDQFIAVEEINPQYMTETNNVIVRLRAPVQAIYIDTDNSGLLTSSLMAKITIIYPELLDSRYLAYLINSAYVQTQLQKNLKNTTIPMVKVSDLLNLEIQLPQLDEQLKVVKFMEASNREIELLNQLAIEKSNLKNKVFDKLIVQLEGK